MPEIVWTELYSVGVPSLDCQHRQLVNTINQLASASMADTNSELIASALEAMVMHAELHFKHEEALLDAAGYTGLLTQRRLHRAFIERVNAFRSGEGARGGFMTRKMELFLREWFVDHILREDMAYAELLQAAGVE